MSTIRRETGLAASWCVRPSSPPLPPPRPERGTTTKWPTTSHATPTENNAKNYRNKKKSRSQTQPIYLPTSVSIPITFQLSMTRCGRCFGFKNEIRYRNRPLNMLIPPLKALACQNRNPSAMSGEGYVTAVSIAQVGLRQTPASPPHSLLIFAELKTRAHF